MQAGVTMREWGATTPHPLTIKNIGGVPMARATVTHEELLRVLDYNPDTGVFRWKINANNNGALKGSVAGKPHSQGYWTIGYKGKDYLAHRLAWFYVHGEWPATDVDHRHGNKRDNRISKLRLLTRSQNNLNRRKLHGVTWYKPYNKWRVRFGKKTLGYRDDFFEACCLRKSAEAKAFVNNS
jgi:hypothetical protein